MIKFKQLLFILGTAMFFTSCAELQPVSIGNVESPKVKTFNKEGIEADFDMRIKNPNSMGVNVYPSEFEATVNGIDLGKVKLNKKVRIKAKSDDVSTFGMKANFSKLNVLDLAKVMQITSSKRATIHLKGEVKAGKWYYKKKFPVEFTKNVSF